MLLVELYQAKEGICHAMGVGIKSNHAAKTMNSDPKSQNGAAW